MPKSRPLSAVIPGRKGLRPAQTSAGQARLGELRLCQEKSHAAGCGAYRERCGSAPLRAFFAILQREDLDRYQSQIRKEVRSLPFAYLEASTAGARRGKRRPYDRPAGGQRGGGTAAATTTRTGGARPSYPTPCSPCAWGPTSGPLAAGHA